MHHPPRRAGRLAFGLFATLFWICVWQVASMAVDLELLLPSPVAVVRALGELVGRPLFWKSAGWSLLRVLAGFAGGVVCGALGGLLSARSTFAHQLFAPLLHVVRAVPVASFIILALVWLQKGFLPVFIAFLMVLPIVWSSTRTAVLQIDAGLLEMAKLCGLKKWGVFKYVKLPSCMPSLLTAAMTSFGFAWKAAIAAEVISRPVLSIGRQLSDAKTYLETTDVFAWTVTVVILSLVIERLLRSLIQRAGRKYNVTG